MSQALLESPPISEGIQEAERAEYERTAVGEYFRELEEHLAAIPVEEEDRRWRVIDGLPDLTHDLVKPRTNRRERRRLSGTLEITTQTGLDELLNQLDRISVGHSAFGEHAVSTDCYEGLLIGFDKLSSDPKFVSDEAFTGRMFAGLLRVVASNKESRWDQERFAKRVYHSLESQFLDRLVADDETATTLPPELQAVWQDPLFLRDMVDLSMSLMRSHMPADAEGTWQPDSYPEFERQLTRKIFSSFGFNDRDIKKLYQAWGSVSSVVDLQVPRRFGQQKTESVNQAPGYIESQFIALLRVASQVSSAPKKLLDRFGIRHFGRYEPQTLINQLDWLELDHTASPEVVLSATGDWNTSHAHTEETATDAQLNSPLFVEADNLAEAVRLLVRIAHYSGPIGTLLVNGHGNKELFSFSRPRDALIKSDTKSANVARLLTLDLLDQSNGATRLVGRNVLASDCSIILNSCEVGVIGGPAQKLADKVGVRVIAPDFQPSGISLDEDGNYTWIKEDDPVAGTEYSPKHDKLS